MSDRETDSPFAEKESNRLIWIVPSVALHLLILLIWLFLPKEPPRLPSERKLTINSEQAEKLQQHVEDANLVMLHSQVTELQAIKKAMAQIRESKMAQLRSFEKEMVTVAPRDAADLFTQLLEAQTKILAAYQQLLEKIQQSEAKSPEVTKQLANDELEAARPALIEIESLRNNALSQMNLISNETVRSSALVNSGEVQLSWLLDSSIEHELSDLKQAMQSAQEKGLQVSSNIGQSYSGKAAQALHDATTRMAEYRTTLKDYAAGIAAGKLAVEQQRRDLQQTIAAAEAETRALQQQIERGKAELKSFGKDEQSRAKAREVNDANKRIQGKLRQKEGQLKKDKASLKRIREFSPDRELAREVSGIQRSLGSIFTRVPDLALIAEATKAQASVNRASRTLLETLRTQSSGSEVPEE